MIGEYLRAIPRAFYSASLYVQVARKWNGLALIYLVLLIMIGLVPASIHFTLKLVQYLDVRDQIIEQMPELQIHKGALSTNVQEPYIITNPLSDQPLFIINTKGNVHDLVATGHNDITVIRAREVELHANRPISQPITYTQMLESLELDTRGDYTVTQDNFRKWAQLLQQNLPTMGIGYFILQTLINCSSFLFRALFLGLVCMGLANIFRVSLDLPACYRLATVAATPVAICELFFLITGIPIFRNEEIIYLLMHGAYCFFAVESVKKHSLSQ